MTIDANPLLEPWTNFHGLPPFDRVRAADFVPAFDLAFAAHHAELAAIANQPSTAGFDDIVAAFDASGSLLRRTRHLFRNLTTSESTPELQAVERDMAPRLAAHRSDIYLDPALFARIDALHERRRHLGLGPEALRLLERIHLDFVLAGSRLSPTTRQRAGAIAERLAQLYTAFSQNLLADEAEGALVLAGEDDLAGLPDALRDAARQAARQRGFSEGSHAIPLSMSAVMPFLSYAERRDLREIAWRRWTGRGRGDGTRDNRVVAREIMALRLELAQLHGRANHADYALQDRMAGTPEAARALLMRVWEPARRRAAEEGEMLLAIARAQGGPVALEPWDWRFYAEQVRRERFAVDADDIRPYFALDAMLGAMFDCADRLFGLRFTEVTGREDAPLYHPDVRAWEVTDAASGAVVALFLGDNFARPTKRGGAWMSIYRSQSRATIGSNIESNIGLNRQPTTPIVVNNNNFAKAPAGEPTLLDLDDLRTLFHEFGHGLHGMLSNVTYERLAGTQVLGDFVELPSQLFEHWAFEPEVLRRHARHVATGEPIPETLIDKLTAARRFNQGFETVQITGPALIDLALHERGAMDDLDIDAFEDAERERLGVPDAVGLRHGLPHFRHLFASDSYAAGYYVYQWAEVLDEDAWNAFVEAGDPFDPSTAMRLKECIYAVGNTVDPRAAYIAFRGRDPRVEPMLAQRGLLGDGPAAAAVDV